MRLHHTILGLLAENQDGGYDLLRGFETSSAMLCPARQGQVYGEPAKLDGNGVIEVTGTGHRNRSNEITCFAALLPCDQTGVTVTAEAGPASPACARPLPRRADGRALCLHRQEEPVDPVCAAQNPALGQGDL